MVFKGNLKKKKKQCYVTEIDVCQTIHASGDSLSPISILGQLYEETAVYKAISCFLTKKW